MDLSLNVGDQKLNIRAACFIQHDNKILFHKDIAADYYCSIGGRIKIGENSEETIKREIMEELHKEIEITGYATTLENFFEMDGKKYHEYMFIYHAEFKDDEDKKITESLKNCEGEDNLIYDWLDIDKIDEYPIMPVVLKDVIKEWKFPVHKINVDI